MNPSTIWHKTCTIDDVNRILLSVDLCKQLKWEAGTTLTVFVNLRNKHMEFLKQDGGHFTLDSHYRVKLTEDLRVSMGWDTGDKLLVKLNPDAAGISLSLQSRG